MLFDAAPRSPCYGFCSRPVFSCVPTSHALYVLSVCFAFVCCCLLLGNNSRRALRQNSPPGERRCVAAAAAYACMHVLCWRGRQTQQAHTVAANGCDRGAAAAAGGGARRATAGARRSGPCWLLVTVYDAVEMRAYAGFSHRRCRLPPQVEDAPAEHAGADGADPMASLSKTQRKKLMKRQL